MPPMVFDLSNMYEIKLLFADYVKRYGDIFRKKSIPNSKTDLMGITEKARQEGEF